MNEATHTRSKTHLNLAEIIRKHLICEYINIGTIFKFSYDTYFSI